MPFRNDEEHETAKKPPISMFEDKITETLLKSRRIFLCDAVDNDSTREIIRKLWYLEATGPGKPILFVINSPGGSTDAGFAIWDQIQMITSPVTTLVTGLAASMGSVLSLAAAPKRRFATPSARIMIHQPLIGGVIRGAVIDLDIHAKEIQKTRQAIVDIYANATGKDPKIIDKAIDRDNWMSAEEALEFGLLDKIVTSYKDL
ncbi:MAG: ATP-dependent Clp protease proteolytic subunit [Verrucomicrobia bacterium]|nr:ATP-dependent Clp protease proteolytic subunit [Verrucomicrobiota bacterium]